MYNLIIINMSVIKMYLLLMPRLIHHVERQELIKPDPNFKMRIESAKIISLEIIKPNLSCKPKTVKTVKRSTGKNTQSMTSSNDML